MNNRIFDELISISLDSIVNIGSPSKVALHSVNFGRIEYQILVNE